MHEVKNKVNIIIIDNHLLMLRKKRVQYILFSMAFVQNFYLIIEYGKKIRVKIADLIVENRIFWVKNLFYELLYIILGYLNINRLLFVF